MICKKKWKKNVAIKICLIFYLWQKMINSSKLLRKKNKIRKLKESKKNLNWIFFCWINYHFQNQNHHYIFWSFFFIKFSFYLLCVYNKRILYDISKKKREKIFYLKNEQQQHDATKKWKEIKLFNRKVQVIRDN